MDGCSHLDILILYEDPRDAAKTVLKEQLGLEQVQLTGPKTVTEVYDIESVQLKNHWDFMFIFFGKLSEEIEPHPAWTELKFIDVSSLPDSAFARSHQDVLTDAGVRKTS